MDGEKLRALIIKNTPLIGEGTNIEIHDVTGAAPYQVEGVSLFRSAYKFNFDPVPYDNWILDGEELHKGWEIMDVMRKHRISPKSKEEAFSIAKYVLYADRDAIDRWQDIKDIACEENGGVYEVRLEIIASPRPRITSEKRLVTVKIGKGICEVSHGDRIPKKGRLRTSTHNT
ncbi:MAG: hypothetical protein JW839_08840 [Candidatus Lokiarchaeota archaeon]|nr:hypothetical protein [Candidatus Lokiarchaeota archaeon]